MTDPKTSAATESKPSIRKAPDTDRHPALAAHPTVDVRERFEQSVATPTDEPVEPSATTAPKQSFWSRLFSRS